MTALIATIFVSTLLLLTFIAWRRYLWACKPETGEKYDTCVYSLTDRFDERLFVNAPHQKDARWLSDIFRNSAKEYPNQIALQIPHTGESLTYGELDVQAERMADALAHYIKGPDQVVAVAMTQDNWQIVAAHLAILKAGGTALFLDQTLPDALLTHMINDAEPVVVLTRGENSFRDLPTLDLLAMPESCQKRSPPEWLDDPEQRLATIFYTSGTTGMPKGVECAHAGYVNLALTYADYFDLLPGYDATTLTSSLGYDGSISEMYSAWVSGCTVVLLTKDEVRSGPDLVPILRDAEVTVLFCPPVLLTTLTTSPEIDLPYPICRYVIPAGEAFPNTLVEPWTRARRQIINTYGPTEASTDTSRQSLRPGEDITIGSPFPNVTYVILEEDSFTPRPHGEVGELCIGGVHLARGYRNLPDQTAKKFIAHPKFGRLYRTGDKCSIDPATYRISFLGRIDTQLKVRGHRVEAQAVEDILQTQFSEIEAAVLDYQNEELVAFVSAPSVMAADGHRVVPAPADWAAGVTNILSAQLPETSVPSRIFLVKSFVLKPVSGKIDRDALPDLLQITGEPASDTTTSGTRPPAVTTNVAMLDDAKKRDVVAGDASAEEVLTICREVFEAPVSWDDTFIKSGGHSINIARLAQRLQKSGWPVSVRSLLTEHNTARKIAHLDRVSSVKQVESIQPSEILNEVSRDESAAQPLSLATFTTLQILFSLILYAPAFVAFLSVFSFVEIGTFFTSATLTAFIAVGCGLYFVGLSVPFLNLAWVMMIKSCLGGHAYKNNVTPGVYPKWSRMHLRIWCINRIQGMVLTPLGAMYRSAPLMAFALRQLGAHVGRNLQCAKDANIYGPLDLITIKNDVAIQTGAYLHCVRWCGQQLHIGPIRLEQGCKIGMRAGIANNVTVGQQAWVTPFTPLLQSVGAGALCEGAPARVTGKFTPLRRAQENCQDNKPGWLLETSNIAMQLGTYVLLTVVPTSIVLWVGRQFIPAGEAELSGAGFTTFVATGESEVAADGVTETGNYFLVTPLSEIAWQLGLYAFATAWVTIVITSILGCLFVRFTATAPGICSPRGMKGALLLYRMSIVNGIQELWTWTITGQYLRALAGLRFPKLGASECDILFNLVPEVTFPDSQVFWSNGCFTNVMDYGADYLTLRRIAMPKNFFSGNNCVAEHGHLPDNFLLGVSTPCSDITHRRQLRTRPSEPHTVAGNPPLEFASASFDDENKTHTSPGFFMFLGRICLNDLFSIGMLRILEGLVFTVLYISLQRAGLGAIAGAVVALILAEIALILSSAAVKQILVGKKWGIDDKTPFWSWRHFTYFFAQDCFFIWCRGPIGALSETVLSNPILRLMGCRIGRRTLVIEPMQCSDWNAVSFGNDCVVGGFLQFHTFENMMLQVKRAHIDDRATVAFGATVMSGAQIENETTLQPLSMALKSVYLQTGTYVGSPAELASAEQPRLGVTARENAAAE